MPELFDASDDWAELALELARDTPPALPAGAPPAGKVERPPGDEAHEPITSAPHATENPLGEGGAENTADEEFEDGDDGSAGESGEGLAEGEQPGTGRKRRRRRRRRRKGGPAVEGAAIPAEAEPAENTTPAAEEPGQTFEEVPAHEAEGTDMSETESTPVPFGVEEDTASDVLRDLIATWNVPSWDEIVGGLYRPH